MNTGSFVAHIVARAMKGVMVQGDPDVTFAGISTDSRTVKPGELFVALHGETFDGHQFVQDALGRGAGGVVVDHDIPAVGNEEFPMIMVPDTTSALGDLALFWRSTHPIPLVAVVGTNGKTTTKEMTAAILGHSYTVLKNPGNLNNLIGLPLSLLKMNSRHQVAVLELGMNQRGEIRRLAQITRPDLAILTNVSEAHLEGLQSLRGVMEAKAEILEGMTRNGRLVFNADDPGTRWISKRYRGNTTSFALHSKADWTAGDIRVGTDWGMQFRLEGPPGVESVSLRTVGEHQIYNALAAAATAHLLGMEMAAIARGLDAVESPPMRMEVVHLNKGITVINDAYNANPLSMHYALKTLSHVATGRTIAVLGDMAELGAYSVDAHTALGREIHRWGINLLFCVGTFAPYIVQGAVGAGVHPTAAVAVENREELSKRLIQSVTTGDWILIKGSRVMKMEAVLDALRKDL